MRTHVRGREHVCVCVPVPVCAHGRVRVGVHGGGRAGDRAGEQGSVQAVEPSAKPEAEAPAAAKETKLKDSVAPKPRHVWLRCWCVAIACSYRSMLRCGSRAEPGKVAMQNGIKAADGAVHADGKPVAVPPATAKQVKAKGAEKKQEQAQKTKHVFSHASVHASLCVRHVSLYCARRWQQRLSPSRAMKARMRSDALTSISRPSPARPILQLLCHRMAHQRWQQRGRQRARAGRRDRSRVVCRCGRSRQQQQASRRRLPCSLSLRRSRLLRLPRR